jgi:hypothetical protein
MQIADLINGLFFEMCAGWFVFNHARAVLRDKEVAGLSVVSVIFFASWGIWNLYYYPSLGQMWSFWGGIAVVSANVYWVYLLLKYARKDQLPRILWGINSRLSRNIAEGGESEKEQNT